MIEQSLFSIEMPYRDPMDVRAFTFGVDDEGRVAGEGADLDAMRRSLCVVAGLRGDEIQQTLVSALLVDSLRDMEVSGSLRPGHLVSVVPCANPASMGIGRRFWPLDKADVNRSFPGDATGEPVQRIAAALLAGTEGYRFGIHLSSFYLEGDFLPHVRIMHGPGNERNHGADFGLSYVTHYVPGTLDTATLHYNWRARGTEAYSFYTKQTVVADERAAKESVRSILRFMGSRKIMDAVCPGGYRSVELAESALVPVAVRTGGVFCPQVHIGSMVEEGQVLAYVRDLLRGGVASQVHAPCDGMVFFRANTPLVNEQTLAFQIAPSFAPADLQ